MGVHASTRASVVSVKQHLWFSFVHQYKQRLVWCSCLVLSLCRCFKLCDLASPASRMALLICACPLARIQTVTVTETQENKLKANGAKRTDPPPLVILIPPPCIVPFTLCFPVSLSSHSLSSVASGLIPATPSSSLALPSCFPVSLKAEGQRGGQQSYNIPLWLLFYPQFEDTVFISEIIFY